MTIDSKPNFSKAYAKANEILVSSNVINEFPFSTAALVEEKSNIRCKKFCKASKYGVDIDAFGSESAIVIKDENDCTMIFYNQEHVPGRVKFSIIHEYGHIDLGHDFSVKNPDIYNKYEIETNYYTAQVLMPEQIIREFKLRGVIINEEFLIKNFGVTQPAAEKRIKTLNMTTWPKTELEKNFDDIILKKFLPWINSIAPLKNYDYLFDGEEERQRERDQWKYNR